MKTKERILEMLYNSEGFVSGEEMAKRLGISRNSVWKGINQLKEDGYFVTSSNMGYCLDSGDELDEFSVKKHLNGEHKLYIYRKESSSNTVAKALCQEGEKEGSVVIVKSQTGGRGRMGRSFISESENGLYMSIILRPKISADKCVNITVAGAVAVLEAIEALSDRACQIKWVNDIYIGEKKCCGILTEASFDFESGGVQYAVIGIGVNLCPPSGGFDKGIEEIACGVYEKEYPKGFKAKLCAHIINYFFKYYNRLDSKEYIKVYKEKSNIIGKHVDVYVGNEVVCGVATDIDDNANLIVRDENGRVHTFNSGEARVRKNEKGSN